MLLKSGKNATTGAKCIDMHVNGVTPLMAAAGGGHEAAVRALLSAKAAIEPPAFEPARVKEALVAAVDADGDGHISVEDLDTDGDGQISFDELVAAVLSRVGGKPGAGVAAVGAMFAAGSAELAR